MESWGWREMINRGRRVFMDMRENPRATDGLEAFKLESLGPEALGYLKKSGATQATPIERLTHMNQPSIDLYTGRGVDLWKEPLEIGVCSQHCNGGFAVDSWWESSVRRLFVVGELAGTHGVKRPGGSALNAGQVGSSRAAQRIAHVYHEHDLNADDFSKLAAPTVERLVTEIKRVCEPSGDAADCRTLRETIQHRMSQHAGMVRSVSGLHEAMNDARREWESLKTQGLKQDHGGYIEALEVRELALAQLGYLEAIKALLERGSGSRGSHLVTDPSGSLPHAGLGDEWKFIPENLDLRREILGISYDLTQDAFTARTTQPNEQPEGEFWFENTWAEYRSATVFKKDPAEKARPHHIYQSEGK